VEIISNENTEIFKDPWSTILKEAGAKVVSRLFSESEDRIDCVIADQTIEPNAIKRINKLKKPLLDPEWVVQSIIMEKKLTFDAHPEFKFKLKNDEKNEKKEISSSPKKAKKK